MKKLNATAWIARNVQWRVSATISNALYYRKMHKKEDRIKRAKHLEFLKHQKTKEYRTKARFDLRYDAAFLAALKAVSKKRGFGKLLLADIQYVEKQVQIHKDAVLQFSRRTA